MMHYYFEWFNNISMTDKSERRSGANPINLQFQDAAEN